MISNYLCFLGSTSTYRGQLFDLTAPRAPFPPHPRPPSKVGAWTSCNRPHDGDDGDDDDDDDDDGDDDDDDDDDE